MTIAEETLRRIPAIVAGNGDRPERARELAEALRRLGNYRWTGVYDVGSEMVTIIAYSGAGTQSGTNSGLGAAHPTFPITKGLTGAAIREKATVVVGDVRNDPRYLTAFGSTVSGELIRFGVKRSDPRSAQQPRTPAPDDLMGSLPKVDDTGAIESLRKITQPLVSDIRIDSAVAIETSGDLRLVVTQADSAFALRLRYGCDGC
jgi:hypothetical protein